MRRLITSLAALIVFSSLSCTDDLWVDACYPGLGVLLESEDAPHMGTMDTTIKLTFLGDFQCPGTATFWYSLSAFMDELEETGDRDRIAVFFRHFPLTEIHNRARAASIAAEAAHRQGNDAFWRIFPMLLKRKDSDLTYDEFLLYAEAAELDVERFAADLEDPDVAAVVDADRERALELGLPGTPSVYLCGSLTTPEPEDLFANIRYLLRQ